MEASALIWVAECAAKTLRLRLPAHDGRPCVVRGKFHVPEGLAWNEYVEARPFQQDAVIVQALLLIKPGYLWDYLAPVSAAVAAQLRYESGNYLPWHPVDAHVAKVQDVFVLDAPITFTQCWNKQGLATYFSTGESRLFVPVGGDAPRVCNAECGPMTVAELCHQFMQKPESIKGLLLPYPLGSLLTNGRISELVLLARYYQKVGRRLESIIPAWPPQEWLIRVRETIHKSYKTSLEPPAPIPPDAIAELAMNLRLWSRPVLEAAGASITETLDKHKVLPAFYSECVSPLFIQEQGRQTEVRQPIFILYRLEHTTGLMAVVSLCLSAKDQCLP